MEQDKKNQSAAPSSDTTSALFVSARKKQLEQQEAERRAKEKEEQRLAAEAEVRRLEQEVAERKRQTQEEARRLEQEVAEHKRKMQEEARTAEEEAHRIAEESRAKRAAAAANPDAVLGVAPEKPQGVKLPGIKMPGGGQSAAAAPTPAPKAPSIPKPAVGTGAVAAKLPMNKKTLIVIGSAVAAVLIVVVVLIAFMGRNDNSGYDYGMENVGAYADVEPGAIIELEDMGGAPAGMKRFYDEDMGLAFNYPGTWEAELYVAGGSNAQFNYVMVYSGGNDGQGILLTNYTQRYMSYINGGGTDGTALTEALIGDVGMIAGYKVTDLYELEYLDAEIGADGGMDFSATWYFDETYGGSASVCVYEDRDVASGYVMTYNVPIDERYIEYINAILLSVETLS